MERIDVQNGMRACEKLQHVLNSFGIKQVIIQPDWPDHEERQYKCYRGRIEREQEE